MEQDAHWRDVIEHCLSICETNVELAMIYKRFPFKKTMQKKS
jgi:hypothetical protein